MPAAEIKEDQPPLKSVGIIAGAGSLPAQVVKACERKAIKPFIVGLEGHTDPSVIQGHDHMWSRVGQAGHIMKTLKSHEIRDIVFIGSLRRPTLRELRPDLKTAEFFTRIGMKALGDNDLLSAIKKTFEEEGFRVHGAHAIAEELLMGRGPLGKYEPDEEQWIDIKRGLDVACKLGAADVGQSVIVQEGIVLGVEAAEGTDALIRRCGPLKRKGRRGVLVKICKPEQDRDMDLPTIGPDTLKHTIDSGLGGIAVYAGLTLAHDPQAMAELADKNKIFVIGLDPENVKK